ncbi:hypothetical protein P7C73_g3374, partial [Tremellales sp. Uapishka_1]
MNFPRFPRGNTLAPVFDMMRREPRDAAEPESPTLQSSGPRPRLQSDATQRREALEDSDTTRDSLTLGQLKAHTAGMAAAKQKAALYDFRYDDTDTLMNELEEFYPHVEMLRIAKNPGHFKASFPGVWTETSLSQRKAYVELQFEYLESPVYETRRAAQTRLSYLIQGSFAETTSPEHQLHWVIENAKTVRAVDGVATLVYALREATRRCDAAYDVAHPKPASTSSQHASSSSTHLPPAEPWDESFAEISDIMGMLYFIVELVLLYWKTILAVLGGMREVKQAKQLSRELSGMGTENPKFTKASPIDTAQFHRDTSMKYPTFAPTPTTSVPSEKLAEAIQPLPVRPFYHSTAVPISVSRSPQHPAQSQPLPGTPAPSPPPSPLVKAKKQQYQTDPTRPFVFPYSRSSQGAPSSLVPFAIAEAEGLYHRHAYVSLGLYQTWQTREECLREERGLGMKGLIGFDRSLQIGDDDDAAAEEAMRREWQYEEEEMEAKERGDKAAQNKAKEKRLAAKRLHRVEIIYRSTLPYMRSNVVILLKALLTAVTGPGAITASFAEPTGFTSPTQEVPPPLEDAKPRTREEVDYARHREVIAKAISGILLLTLQWFKASHIMKFHHFAQHMYDANTILLLLKMFGLSDVSMNVQRKSEYEDSNFFRYCYLNCSKSPPTDRPEDSMLDPIPKRAPKPALGEDEIELITEYSWRNFFSSINFLKILQKLTKHMAHRVGLLVHYKSWQVLKRILKINQPMLQLQALKLIKGQMPFCGRKWRQTNMKLITSIYLNCRPELRDEWLAGVDLDTHAEEAAPQETALRALIAFYNKSHYSAYLSPAPLTSPEPSHNRSASTNAVILEDPAIHLVHHHRSPSIDADVFPPRRSAADAMLPYNPDGMVDYWVHEYDDIMSEVFGEDDERKVTGIRVGAGGALGREEHDSAIAWEKLGEIMGNDESEISDSESVVSIGELGEEARNLGPFGMGQRRKSTDNENTWEHMSPTLKLLPKSPSDRRRSSGGSPLRPVIAAGNGHMEDSVFEDDDTDLRGPMPIERETVDEEEREFGAVDEVEYAYGE